MPLAAQPATAVPATAPACGTRAYIALGANLGEPMQTLCAAFAALDQLPQTRLIARSALYRSAPLDAPGQPDYFNAVAAVDTDLAPRPLLDALLALEADFGRVRTARNAARTLDLDLLLHGESLRDDPHLTLPHPRMHQRAFVLLPLAEIDPKLQIPGRGLLADLLHALDEQRIERIDALC